MNFVEDILVTKFENITFCRNKGIDEAGSFWLRHILGCIEAADSADNKREFLICLKALMTFNEEIFDLYLIIKASEISVTSEARLEIITGLKVAVLEL